MARDGAELAGLLLAAVEEVGCEVDDGRDFDGAPRTAVVVGAHDAVDAILYPALLGCMTQAESLYEIGPMAQDAYVAWTRACQDDGIEIPASDLEVGE